MRKTPYYLTQELQPSKSVRNPGQQPVPFESMSFDFTFLTDEEYIEMNKYLKKFMLQKFKYFDEEMVHKAILQGYRFAHKYDETKSKKSTWLCKILYNLVLAEQKKERITLSLDTKVNTDNDTNWSDMLSIQDDDDSNIPENYEEILWQVSNNSTFSTIKMRVEGKSYKDIADIKDVPVSTVKSRLSRERGQLKDLLEEMKLSGR